MALTEPADSIPLQRAILKTLAYFDVFDFPLTWDELCRYLSVPCPSETELTRALEILCRNKCIRCHDSLYYLAGRDHQVSLRHTRQQRAAELMEIAQESVRVLKNIPFVRGIYLSGDLSKGVCNHNQSDIDYFLIVAPHRVYVVKLFLALFRRIRRFNPDNLYCFNYIISESALAIGPPSLYFAYEIAGLQTLFNEPLLDRFRQANAWVALYVPNYRNSHYAGDRNDPPVTAPVLQDRLEWPFRIIPVRLLDRMLCRLWRLGWWVKYRRRHKIRRLMIKGAQPEFCKAHGHRTDLRVISAYRQRLNQLGLYSEQG